MDRMIHTLMNSMQASQDLHAISAQNLANMNVPGYRRDLPTGGSTQKVDDGSGFAARMFQVEAQHGAFSAETGFMEQSGDPYDIAIMDEGFFYAQEGDGTVGLSRRGDLRTDGQGRLVNGANEFILNAAQQPIVLPPYKSMQITEVGQIVIEPLDGAPGEKVEVATIATVVPPANAVLIKGQDGLIRDLNDQVPAPNQLATVKQGVLEGSNVNATEELIASIDIQRGFEMNMRMINTAKELDEAGAEVMRAPAV